MFEEIVGHVQWPAAIIITAIIAAWAFSDYQTRQDKFHLKQQIVQICSGKPDVQQCAINIANSVNRTK